MNRNIKKNEHLQLSSNSLVFVIKTFSVCRKMCSFFKFNIFYFAHDLDCVVNV